MRKTKTTHTPQNVLQGTFRWLSGGTSDQQRSATRLPDRNPSLCRNNDNRYEYKRKTSMRSVINANATQSVATSSIANVAKNVDRSPALSSLRGDGCMTPHSRLISALQKPTVASAHMVAMIVQASGCDSLMPTPSAVLTTEYSVMVVIIKPISKYRDVAYRSFIVCIV